MEPTMFESESDAKQIMLREYKRKLSKDLGMVFVTLPSEEVLRLIVPVDNTIFEVQKQVAAFLHCPPQNLVLLNHDIEYDPWVRLAYLPIKKRRINTFQFVCLVATPESTNEVKNVLRTTRRGVKIIDNMGETTYKMIVKENQDVMREWCGGFRNKVTKVYYFNTWTQTIPKVKKMGLEYLRKGRQNRQIQTPVFPIVDTSAETDHSVGTQTWKHELYIPSTGDRILEPGDYTSAQEGDEQQSIWRLIIMKRFKNICRRFVKQRKERFLEQKKQMILQREVEDRKLALVKYVSDTIFPTNRSGFENLYILVNNWYNREKEKLLRFFGTPKDPGYRTFLIDLFHKKLRLLGEIERMRIVHRKEALSRKEIKKFESASKPKVVMYEKGNVTVTYFEDQQRASEYKEIFSLYLRKDCNKEGRLEILCEIKDFLESFQELDVTQPIVELINREIELTVIDVKYLDGLQRRIRDLLLDFFTKSNLHLESHSGKDDVTFRCPSCMELKPPSGFTWCMTENPRYCTACSWLVDRSFGRPGLQPYMVMLNHIKEDEDLTKNYIPLLVKPTDIMKIVTEIWEGKSVLSGEMNKLELRLPKWNNSLPWSPWNCVLLTIGETAIHKDYEEVEKCYSEGIVQKIKTRHMVAQRRFAKLRVFDYMNKDKESFFKRIVPNSKIKEVYNAKDPFFNVTRFKIRSGY